MAIEDLDQVVERLTLAVVQPGRQRQHAVADLRARQGVGHARLDLFLAVRAPVAMDRVFRDHRLDVFGDVFGIADARLRTALQSPLAMRTAGRAVLLVLVDLLWRWATRPFVPGFLPRFFAAARRVGLLVNRLHAGRGGGRTDRRALPLRAPQLGRQLQQCEDHRFLALFVNAVGLVGRQIRPQYRRIAKSVASGHDTACLPYCVQPLS